MKYYMAPLEGITNVHFRSAFDKHYGKIDKYYIPFLTPRNKNIHQKEQRETNPEDNRLSGKVIPQIISKNIDDTLWLMEYLQELGYDEVNLNFGCPSGTVVAKGKGAGMLKDLQYMDHYLAELFAHAKCRISVKLRIGLENPDEFDAILAVLNKYPITELIIHPRTAVEQYSGKIHFEVLENLNEKTDIDVIYNGEIHSMDDVRYIVEKYPFVKGVMIGRGLIAYPDMLQDMASDEERLQRLKEFYYDFSSLNIRIFGWNNSKFFHKEIWAYLIHYFDCPPKLSKKLFKAEKEEDFKNAVEEIFSTCGLNKHITSIKEFV